MAGSIENLLDWFKDNIKRISTRALETIARIVYTIPLAEDWQTTDPVTSWTCPEGQYEVFVNLNGGASFMLLNGKSLTYDGAGSTFPTDVWLPAFSNSLFVLANIDPATGDASGAITFTLVTCSEGWKLSVGDVLTAFGATAFIVRYRRIA